MRGVDRTRDLKFDHPGLDTTVARSGSRLLIQNDLGETNAHVVIVTIEAMDDRARENPATDKASFRVFRRGSVTDALSVSYSVSGTATPDSRIRAVTSSGQVSSE